MTLKLEVGKCYLDGYGTIQGPMKENIHSLVYRFISQNETYTAKGAYDIDLMSKYDLITECNADGSPIEPPAPAIDPHRYALLEDLAKAVEEHSGGTIAKGTFPIPFRNILLARDALRTPPPKRKVYTMPSWDKMSADEYNKFREATAR